MNREEIKRKYLELSSTLQRKPTRKEFVKSVGISRRQIDNIFGSFYNLKQEAAGVCINFNTDTPVVKSTGKSLSTVLESCGVDEKVWEVSEHNFKELSNGEFLFTVYLKKKKIQPIDIANFLKQWVLPNLQPMNFLDVRGDKSDKVFVVALSDLHYGASANARYMFNRPEWSTKKTVECVDQFSRDILNEVGSRNYKFKKCIILGLGDLIHSLNGKTQRGTELIYDCIKEEQFEYAINSLVVFINRMIECFGTCEVHSVSGNHSYDVESALWIGLKMCYQNDKRISFNHYSSRPCSFKCDKTLFMMDHGADSHERAYVPMRGPKLEKHVQTLLVNNPQLLVGTKTKLFIQGDKHHFSHIEYSTFEFLMFGTILGGDEHANVNNLHNRARQSCLVIDSNGLREIIHVYFD